MNQGGGVPKYFVNIFMGYDTKGGTNFSSLGWGKKEGTKIFPKTFIRVSLKQSRQPHFKVFPAAPTKVGPSRDTDFS